MRKKFGPLSTIIIASLSIQNAFAEYSASEKSVTLTAETLPKDSGEVGLLSLSYGITDNLQMTVPTLPLAFGFVTVGAKYKFMISERFIISPSASLGYYFPDGGGAAASAMINTTFRFDSNTEALSVGVGALNTSRIGYGSSSGWEIDRDLAPTWYLNYDWYTKGGNLWYVGVVGLLPYGGFTWAWTNIHFGVGLAAIIPYAHFYWKFFTLLLTLDSVARPEFYSWQIRNPERRFRGTRGLLSESLAFRNVDQVEF